jgi:phosphate-selective porin OprO and OprP
MRFVLRIASVLGVVAIGATSVLAQSSPAGPAADSRPDSKADSRLDDVVARLSSIEQRLANLEGQAPTAPAAAPPVAVPTVTDLAARLEAVDEQVRIVDRKREIDQEALATRFSQAPVVDSSRDGFSVRSADSTFHFKIGGYFQADSRFFAGPRQAETSTFILRRVRPVLTGTLYRWIEFRLMPDWGQGQTVLQDLHLDFRFFPKASVRFGKFKAPFSLERLQSATDLTFTERAYPTNLAPNRDTGVQVYGDFKAGTFTYALAAMNGVPDGGSSDLDTNDGKDYVGRMFFQPFITKGATHKASGLGFGIAASHGRQSGTTLPTYRTTPQSAFFTFTTGTTADGDRKRLGPQGHYYVGPFGIFAEYTVTEQDVRRDTTTATIRNDGWQVATSYFLTGEAKAYRTPAPKDAFDRSTGGKGAFELAARYTELSIDPSAFQLGLADPTRSARKAQEWTAGFNWYVARGQRFILDYSQTHFTGGSATGNRQTEKVLLSRFQVAF